MGAAQTFFILFPLSLAIGFGFLGRYIAIRKNINPKDGFIVGFLTTIIGILILLIISKREIPFTKKNEYIIHYHIKNKTLRIALKVLASVFILIVFSFIGILERPEGGGSFISPVIRNSIAFYSFILIFSRFSNYTIWGREEFIGEHKDPLKTAHEIIPPILIEDNLKSEVAIKDKIQIQELEKIPEKREDKFPFKTMKLKDGRTMYIDENGELKDLDELEKFELEDGSVIFVKEKKIINPELISESKSKDSMLDELSFEEQAENSFDAPLNSEKQTEGSNEMAFHLDNNQKIFIGVLISFFLFVGSFYIISERKIEPTILPKKNKEGSDVITSPQRTINSLGQLNNTSYANSNSSSPKPNGTSASLNNREQKNRKLAEEIGAKLEMGNSYSISGNPAAAITVYSAAIRTLTEHGITNLSNQNLKTLSILYYKRGLEKSKNMNQKYSVPASLDIQNSEDVLKYLKD